MISLGFILIGLTIFHAIEKTSYVVTKLFPALESHDTQDVIFGVCTIIPMLAWVFSYSCILLCDVDVIDITFIGRILHEQLDGVF